MFCNRMAHDICPISLVDPISTSRIAAQLVTGIGFLVAGVLLKANLLIKENLNAHIYQIKKVLT